MSDVADQQQPTISPEYLGIGPNESLTHSAELIVQADHEAFVRYFSTQEALENIESQGSISEFLIYLNDSGKINLMHTLIHYLLLQTPHLYRRRDQFFAVYMLGEGAPETSRILGEGAYAVTLIAEDGHYKLAALPGLSADDVNQLVVSGHLPEACKIEDPNEYPDDLLKDI